MDKRVIFDNGNGGVSVLIPAPNSGLSILDIAKKDVPENVAFWIVDVSDIPSDRTFRDAWVLDMDRQPDGYGRGGK